MVAVGFFFSRAHKRIPLCPPRCRWCSTSLKYITLAVLVADHRLQHIPPITCSPISRRRQREPHVVRVSRVRLAAHPRAARASPSPWSCASAVSRAASPGVPGRCCSTGRDRFAGFRDELPGVDGIRTGVIDARQPGEGQQPHRGAEAVPIVQQLGDIAPFDIGLVSPRQS